MNKKINQILAFDTIKQHLTEYVASPLGQEEIARLEPSTTFEEIQSWQEETDDGVKLLRIRGGMPIPKMDNIQPHIKRLEIGAVLSGVELAQIGRILSATTDVVRFFDKLKEDEIELMQLYTLSTALVHLPEVDRLIRQSIDEDGHILDDASQTLKGIRTGLKKAEAGIREKLDNIVRGKQAKLLSDAIVTMRNDRYVIPVKQEYRTTFGGIVHDQSASGQTLFIEPQSVVDQNNRLRQLQIEERQEMDRILAEISNEIAPFSLELLQNMRILGRLDFTQAKAKYGREIKGSKPIINAENHVYFKSARHPLLNPDTVVANDIMLGKDYQAIVITGPNTGGKTLTLKTLGLLQLMGQAGLQLPVDEESEMGIFTEIFADIGDEQSIEQSLSTFSSHMTNIVHILDKLTPQTLVLFDELGAGTDPQEGAALAIAILDYVGTTGAYVMATTHYPELKAYGYNRKGTINASVEFDVETLSPTYKLLIGVPGRSNAFDISKRLGLEPVIIDAAKGMIDAESQNVNEMIEDLENRRKMVETEYLEVRYHVEEAESLQKDLEKSVSDFYQEREQLLEVARQKANEMVEKAQDESEKIIKDLRHMQLTGQHSGGIKEHQLIDAKTQLSNLHQEELTQNKVLKKAKAKQQLAPGKDVMVASLGQRGTLIEQYDDKHWQVQMGILKMKLKTSDLTLAQSQEEPVTKRVTTVRSSTQSHVSTELDLRGERYESALAKVDQYLDAAILAGYPQVTIIHGKGTGALRQGVNDLLKGHRSVKSFSLAPANQGGSGATVVLFK